MIKPFIFFIFFISHFVFSQDIVGNYSSVESKCKLNLKINDDNTFTFSVGKVKNKGFLKVSKDSNVTYLDFTDPNKNIYDEKVISVQVGLGKETRYEIKQLSYKRVPTNVFTINSTNILKLYQK